MIYAVQYLYNHKESINWIPSNEIPSASAAICFRSKSSNTPDTDIFCDKFRER